MVKADQGQFRRRHSLHALVSGGSSYNPPRRRGVCLKSLLVTDPKLAYGAVIAITLETFSCLCPVVISNSPAPKVDSPVGGHVGLLSSAIYVLTAHWLRGLAVQCLDRQRPTAVG
jgi:hypothetical protein